jgi:TonB family protein
LNSTRSRRRALLTLLVIASCLPMIAVAQTPTPLAEAQDITQAARPSVVTLILRDSSGNAVPIGSGFFTVSGSFIATSYKSIKDIKDVSAIRVKVFGHEQTYGVLEVWASSKDLDIALLRISNWQGKPMPLGNTKQVSAGEIVYVAADGAGDASRLREANFTGVKVINSTCYALITPRAEWALGSPVVNERGEVIGILVSPPKSDQKHSFAAPVSQIKWLMTRGPASSGLSGEFTGRIHVSDKDANCIGAFSSPQPPVIEAVPSPQDMKAGFPKIIRKSGGVLQGSATRRVMPEYPIGARSARVSGQVVVEVTVDEQGNVISVQAISGDPMLRDAARDAARGWKFRPTQLNGVPMKVIGTLTFNFNL